MKIIKSKISTNTNANKGMNMDVMVMIIEVPFSTAETTGFITPAVVAVDVKRVTLEVPEIAAAVPPPAIIAKAHVITGLKSDTVESITTVPANAASGTETVSKRLSTYGIK